MKYIFWIIIAFIISWAIYWLMDWHDKHEDGE